MMLLVIDCIHFYYFSVVKMKFFADFICYISILPKELGIAETFNGKTGLYLSDGKVRIFYTDLFILYFILILKTNSWGITLFS